MRIRKIKRMKNDETILAEIKHLKTIVARFLGTEDLPAEQKFSDKVLDKGAKEFKKLSKERREWVETYKISDYLDNAPYGVGNFIRNELGFTNFYKRGSIYYYSRRDLMSLDRELKKRNVNLATYMELKEDKVKFKKYVASIFDRKERIPSPIRFLLPSDLRNITTTPAPKPKPEVLRTRLEKLQDDFFAEKLSEYIDIYKGNHALLKAIYPFEKYLDMKLRRRIHRWTNEFNLLNSLLEEITKKKEKFVPVSEEKMIRL